METVNSQISASHQSATGTKNPIGPYRGGPPRRRRCPRKSRADRRLDMSQRTAPLKLRKKQNDLYTDALKENTSVVEFSIDGLYPNDDVTYPPPPNFSHYQISAQECADIVSPRARDVNHNHHSSIRGIKSACCLREDSRCENHERTPYVFRDEWEHKIHSEGPREEPCIQNRRAANSVPYNNERGRRAFLQTSILPYVISPPASRDPSLSTVHDTGEQNTDEVEAPKAEAAMKGSEARPQVVKAMSNIQEGHSMVDIDGELSRERDVILPVPQRPKSPLAIPLGKVIPKTKSPAHNMKLNRSSGGAPVSRTSKSIGGPWTNQKYQMFSNFDMWP